MNTIEDCARFLAIQPNLNNHLAKWDHDFICDVAYHDIYSTNQAKVISKILSKYSWMFGDRQFDCERIVANQIFKTKPYESIEIKREVRRLNHNTLIFRFKSNKQISEEFKKIKCYGAFKSEYTFNRLYRCWIITADVHNHEILINFIKKHGFGFDDSVIQLFHDLSTFSSESTAVIENNSITVECGNDLFVQIWLEERGLI